MAESRITVIAITQSGTLETLRFDVEEFAPGDYPVKFQFQEPVFLLDVLYYGEFVQTTPLRDILTDLEWYVYANQNPEYIQPLLRKEDYRQEFTTLYVNYRF